MDPLTDVISIMRIARAGFTRLEASIPWGIEGKDDPAIKFVFVASGDALLKTGSLSKPIVMERGDVFIILGNEPYEVSDRHGSPKTACLEVEARRVGDTIRLGGGGAATTLISGFFEIDQQDATPLLSALPALLHLKKEQGHTSTIQAILELLAAEIDSPGFGSETAIAGLFEVLLVHAVRAVTRECPTARVGWLAAIFDKKLAPVIRAMHSDPQRDWTVEMLARAAGMSRSAFASHFKNVVGQTPLGYLTMWRIRMAARMIESGSHRLSDIAHKVGYESETSFTKAFKRITGSKPSAFKKSGRAHVVSL